MRSERKALMAHPSKRKGDWAEREISQILGDMTGWPVKRRGEAGAAKDIGDLVGIPDTCVEVKYRPDDVARSIREGLVQLAAEQFNKGCTFGVLFVRRRGGQWVAVMDLEQWATWAREAITDTHDAEASGKG
jgi:Holliday junction resolvase